MKDFYEVPLAHQIRESLLRFPSLYDNAGGVLHHLYFVIGNGYEWSSSGILAERGFGRDEYVGGESLVEYVRRMDSTDRIKIRNLLDHVSDILTTRYEDLDPLLEPLPSGETFEWSYDQEKNNKYHDNRENLDQKASDFSFDRSGLYPICPDYACFFEVPDNVQDDYLIGALVSGIEYLYQLEQGNSERGTSDPPSKENFDHLMSQFLKLYKMAESRNLLSEIA